MECAENDGQGLGSDDRLSCHSRDDVLAPRTARAGLDAGDSGNGFGSRNRGVLTSQTGRATRLHEASPQERRWAHWTAIGTGSALRDLQLLVNSVHVDVEPRRGPCWTRTPLYTRELIGFGQPGLTSTSGSSRISTVFFSPGPSRKGVAAAWSTVPG